MGIQDNMLQIQVEKMHRSKSRSLFSTGETSPSPDGMAVGKRVPRCHVQLSSTHPVSVCAFWRSAASFGLRGGVAGDVSGLTAAPCRRFASVSGRVSPGWCLTEQTLLWHHLCVADAVLALATRRGVKEKPL